ncbi:uncharacterized protein LOC111082943 isoform X2 [Drosophila obscura]|uniref:uncharacterized protein LOC111082943 isoform X2 n=1 Tax=Drosophila obscura TaxID=7282 RepID=UPI001BB0E439|nr:uncharacterized protein LOC111082943 isoform X2 [Drosophila obscura]
MSLKSVNSFVKCVTKKQRSVSSENQKNHEINGKLFTSTDTGKQNLKVPAPVDSKTEKGKQPGIFHIVSHTDAHEICEYFAVDLPPEKKESRDNIDKVLYLLAAESAESTAVPKTTEGYYKMEQLDGAAAEMGHENDPEFRAIEQPEQAACRDLNQWPKNAQKDVRLGGIGSGSEDTKDSSVCHDSTMDNEQQNAPSATEINGCNIVIDKAISDGKVQLKYEDSQQLPTAKDPREMPDREEYESIDFIQVMNDGLVEELNQVKELSTAAAMALEEGEVSRDSDMQLLQEEQQQQQLQASDCEEGEVLSDDSFYKPDKGDGQKGHNYYQMFEKKQLPRAGLRAPVNYLMGMHPYEQLDADLAYFPPHRPLMRIGPLLPTPLFMKALPIGVAENRPRKELGTHQTTTTDGASISWRSVRADSPTREPELLRSGGSSPVQRKTPHSPPVQRKTPHSPPVTLRRSRSRCPSPSVSPPRYARHFAATLATAQRRRSRSSSRTKSRRCFSSSSSHSPAHRTAALHLSFSPRSSPSPPNRSAMRHPANRYHSPTPPMRRQAPIRPMIRQTPIRPMRRRSPSLSMRRRSPSLSMRRRSPSPPKRPRSPSPTMRRRLSNAPKQSQVIVRSKLMTKAAAQPRLRNASPMAKRKRKLSTSSSSSYATTDGSTSSSDDALSTEQCRVQRSRRTPKKGPHTPTGSPPTTPQADGPGPAPARKKYLQMQLARLNEKIGAAKRMRQFKLKLAAKTEARYRS